MGGRRHAASRSAAARPTGCHAAATCPVGRRSAGHSADRHSADDVSRTIRFG